MSSRGVADIVFCLDASTSMKPCIDGVRQHVVSLIEGLTESSQVRWDARFDFLAYAASEAGQGRCVFRLQSALNEDFDSLHEGLYGEGSGRFFTDDVGQLKKQLDRVVVSGDEASLVALDSALDFPWRDAAQCHRVVVLMTDEPFERGVFLAEQRERLAELQRKIQELRVMLYMVTPESAVFSRLAEVDRCEHIVVGSTGDGLAQVDFREVLGYIGKSVSAAGQQQAASVQPRRALFGQDRWVRTDSWSSREG